MIHPAARQGFTSAAQTYARARPDYPEALVEWLEQALGLRAGRLAVDLGAGTGKFTGLLLRTGTEVTAVEPLDAMRAELTAALPGVRALAGSAEAIPLPDAIADVVVCAQAFHWFADESALAEIHRVLRPSGRLGLVWNVRDESVDWVAALTAIIGRYGGSAPHYHSGAWRRVFQGRWFSDPVEASFPYQQVGPAEEVIVDRSLTVSYIAALPDNERADVREQLRALVASHPALRGRGSIAFPYRTFAYSCNRLDAGATASLR
jgi:SAM-dependent methyltransferase